MRPLRKMSVLAKKDLATPKLPKKSCKKLFTPLSGDLMVRPLIEGTKEA